MTTTNNTALINNNHVAELSAVVTIINAVNELGVATIREVADRCNLCGFYTRRVLRSLVEEGILAGDAVSPCGKVCAL